MDNFKLIKKTLIILVALTILTIIMLVLLGKNGLIRQEIDDYNKTHIEENSDNQNDKIIEVNN